MPEAVIPPRVYGVPSTESLVSSKKKQLWSWDGREALGKVVELHYQGYEWVLKADYPYASEREPLQILRFSTGIKSGPNSKEIMSTSGETNIADIFDGLEITHAEGPDAGLRKFDEDETGPLKSHTAEVKINMFNGQVKVWQKMYNFNTEIYFWYDHANQVRPISDFDNGYLYVLRKEVCLDSFELAVGGGASLSDTHGTLKVNTVPVDEIRHRELYLKKNISSTGMEKIHTQWRVWG